MHRSVVIVPPEGGLEFSAELTKKIVLLFMSRLTSSLGIPYKIVIESRITHASSSSQEALLRKTAARGSRKIAECTSYTPCVLLSFAPNSTTSLRVEILPSREERHQRGTAFSSQLSRRRLGAVYMCVYACVYDAFLKCMSADMVSKIEPSGTRDTLPPGSIIVCGTTVIT